MKGKTKKEVNGVRFKREKERNQKVLMAWYGAVFDQVLGLKMNSSNKT